MLRINIMTLHYKDKCSVLATNMKYNGATQSLLILWNYTVIINRVKPESNYEYSGTTLSLSIE
jgi:hypothetical protein